MSDAASTALVTKVFIIYFLLLLYTYSITHTLTMSIKKHPKVLFVLGVDVNCYDASLARRSISFASLLTIAASAETTFAPMGQITNLAVRK